MSHRKIALTSIPWFLASACAAPSVTPEDAKELDSTRRYSVCGASTDWQDVERYDGTLGADNTSKEFVRRHERPVGNIKWDDNFRARYANPGDIADGERWCTGTLIGPNLMITAGHCFEENTGATPSDWTSPTDPATGTFITPQQHARDMEVSFNHQLDAAGAPQADDRYDITALREYKLGGLDYAIIELAGSPGDKYGWARPAALWPEPGDELTIIQHPNGIPKVVDGGTVFSVSATGLLAYDDLDTDPGSSGSGILDWQGRLIGVHTSGGCTPGLSGNEGHLVEAIVPHSELLSLALREVGEHSETIASGDFDGDGFQDIAMGVPTSWVGDLNAAGAVRLIYGSATGPDDSSEGWLDQNTAGIDGIAEHGDFFGAALVAADFNGDNYDDLAIGAPGEDLLGAGVNAGGVWVLYGGPTGLDGSDSTSFDQQDRNIAETAEDNDRMGSALAAADFNADGFMDLAIGVPGEDVSGQASSGAITVLYGSASGIVTAGNELWDQATANSIAENEAGDRFGSALAAGDFDSDGYADIAIGVPYEDSPGAVDSGAVSVLYGSATKLDAPPGNRFTQGTAGMAGVLERGDRFGFSVAAGDVNGDGFADLITGAPGEDIGAKMHAGFVHAIYGSGSGLTSAGDVGLSENSPDVPDVSQPEDRMGTSVACGQFDSTDYDVAEDVLIGVPGETSRGSWDAGLVIQLLGQSGALSGEGSEAFSQNTADVQGVCEKGDRVGTVVFASDANGDGHEDGIFSAVGEDQYGWATPEAFHVLFSDYWGVWTTDNVLL